MSLSANTTHSKKACEYILNIIKMKGANWDQYRGAASFEGCLKSGGSYVSCSVHKDTVDICLYDQVRPTVRTLTIGASTMLEQMEIIAEQSKLKKCGNCGEFSALAFIYLYKKGVRPLDWMALVGGDHAFVVIGRDNADANDYAHWGSNAVVCDPWGQGFRSGNVATGTYAGTAFNTRMRGLVPFTGVRSLHREA